MSCRTASYYFGIETRQCVSSPTSDECSCQRFVMCCIGQDIRHRFSGHGEKAEGRGSFSNRRTNSEYSLMEFPIFGSTFSMHCETLEKGPRGIQCIVCQKSKTAKYLMKEVGVSPRFPNHFYTIRLNIICRLRDSSVRSGIT